MKIRQGLARGTFFLFTSTLIFTLSNSAQASSRSCEYRLDPIQAITLKSLRERNTEALQKEIKAHPMPGFDFIEKEIIEKLIADIPDDAYFQTDEPRIVKKGNILKQQLKDKWL